MELYFVDIELRSLDRLNTYLLNGVQYDSFIGKDGIEYIRLIQRYVDHGFKRPRWETPYIRVPIHAIKIRDIPK